MSSVRPIILVHTRSRSSMNESTVTQRTTCDEIFTGRAAATQRSTCVIVTVSLACYGHSSTAGAAASAEHLGEIVEVPGRALFAQRRRLRVAVKVRALLGVAQACLIVGRL